MSLSIFQAWSLLFYIMYYLFLVDLKHKTFEINSLLEFKHKICIMEAINYHLAH